MVKAYLRYEQSQAWGVITSNSNICYDHSGKYLVASSLENVSIWNIKQGLVVRTLIPPQSQSNKPPGEVTHLAPSPISSQIAVGHSDGTIRLWDILTGTCQSTFAGHHRSAVTALRFDPTGAFLVSGSKDTDLILWDIAAESGLVKLRGHRGQITDAAFLTLPSRYTTTNGDDQHGNGTTTTTTTTAAAAKHLVSCAKDGLVKVWDLDTQHCIQTIMVGTGEAWSLDVNSSHTRVAVGSNDAELRLYSIAPSSSPSLALGGSNNDDSYSDNKRDEVLVAMGSLRRTAAERAATVRFHDIGGVTLLTCQGAGKVTEIWRVRSEGEAGKKAKRRKKRRREKKGEDDGDGKEEEEEDALVATDELEAVSVIRSNHKVRSFAYAPSTNTQSSLIAGTKRNLRSNSAAAIAAHGTSSSSTSTQARLILSLTNNSLEIWDIKEGEASPEKSQVLDTAGHRSDIRALALSSDDSLCASASSSGIKLWNAHTGVCLRSVESGYGLSVVFAPGNKHVVVGTKEGSLEIINLNSGEKKVIADAHGGAVWSLALLPDGSGLVSGSADHSVKFWEWQLLSNEGGGKTSSVAGTAGAGLNCTATELSLKNTKTLKMNDDVLCVRVSPDNKLLAVALLDSTVRVFFVDSLKFYLAMYGHKLPVLSMDISSDGTLLATGSADKNLRIWGLDFGDCHRSLFAHNDSVMCVAFVPKTHYLFTAGKDKTVRYWDADKYEELLTLEGHHGEVWSLAVSSFGDFVVSGSHDRSLRRWERTEEPFFLEEEKEKRLDSLFEADLEGQDGRGALSLGGGGGNDEEEGEDGGKGGGEGVAAGRKTLETVSAADAIVEALELAGHEEERIRAAAQEAATTGNNNNLTPNPMLLGRPPSQHVLSVVAGVRASDLEQALLLLPFNDALTLLDYLVEWLQQGSQVELLCRISTLLLRVHMQQLIGTPTARPVLIKLKELLRSRVQYMKDMVGFNVAAMTHLQRAVKMRSFAAGGGGDGEEDGEEEDGGAVGAAAVAVKKIKRKMEQSTAQLIL